ncbi:MAG: uroporphyrinogen-III synthase [Bryobacteraceae bacterium]
MRPLGGLRIVVTRASHQAEELAQPLRDSGAEVILLPVVGIAPPADPEPLRSAAEHCDEYDWIIFTSTNAVAAFAAELSQGAKHCTSRIATVGSTTRQAAENHGFRVSITPREYVAESLVQAFEDEDLTGRRILIPSAAVTRDVVRSKLQERGAQVRAVEAYRNVIPEGSAERARTIFREPYPDWVTFASSSAVENLVRLIGIHPLHRTRIATIGPITSETVRKHALAVAAEAGVHSVSGLLDLFLA